MISVKLYINNYLRQRTAHKIWGHSKNREEFIINKLEGELHWTAIMSLPFEANNTIHLVTIIPVSGYGIRGSKCTSMMGCWKQEQWTSTKICLMLRNCDDYRNGSNSFQSWRSCWPLPACRGLYLLNTRLIGAKDSMCCPTSQQSYTVAQMQTKLQLVLMENCKNTVHSLHLSSYEDAADRNLFVQAPWMDGHMSFRIRHQSNWMEWFEEHNEFKVLSWPPNSPDLNPINQLWDMLDKLVRSMKASPPNSEVLKGLLLTSWCKTPQDTLESSHNKSYLL